MRMGGWRIHCVVQILLWLIIMELRKDQDKTRKFLVILHAENNYPTFMINFANSSDNKFFLQKNTLYKVLQHTI